MRPSLLQALALVTAVLIPGLCSASVVTVPDDYATIQAAIDFGVDTVLVREGDYPEVLQTNWGVAILGIGPRRPRLAGLMISNPFEGFSKIWSIRDIDISGLVTITTANPRARLLDISFARCRLGQGLRHGSTDPNDIDRLVLSNCLIEGFFDARSVGFEMHSDTATAGVSCTIPDGFVTVDSCWFRGGDNYALRLGASDQTEGSVVGNLFEDTARGVYLTNCFRVTFQSNVVRRASGRGMELEGQHVLLKDNDIRDCELGLLRWFGETVLIDNRITGTASHGAHFYAPERLRAERNVIGRCGGSAVWIQEPSYSELRIAQNTFYGSGSSGVLIGDGGSVILIAEANIVSNTSAWGIEVQSVDLQSATLRCNDWFANSMGAVNGIAMGEQDIALDPGFCDAANGDFRLYADSPLLSQTMCGQIGALGFGCSPPALRTLSVASNRTGLAVQWELESAFPIENWVERADQAVGPWDSLGTGAPSATSGRELLDSAIAPDRAYHYRVAWRDRGTVVRGSSVIGVWADADRLSSATPNPASNEVKVEWVLAQPGRTDIRVFDLAGREVAVVAKGTYNVGRNHAQWDGYWRGHGPAPSGMYIVRISSPDQTTSHRVLLVR